MLALGQIRFETMPYQSYTHLMSKPNFEWDEAKDPENQQKHGVPFLESQHAFLDKNRVIAEDLGHSQKEQRFTALGKIRIKVAF